MAQCHYCERTQDLEQQIAGYWFCFHCLPRALARGAYYWVRLARALNPWR